MFIENDLTEILKKLDKLKEDTQPIWGTMSAQRMVEHLMDTMCIAVGENPQTLIIPKEKLPGMLRFLDSDKEMMKNVEVPFAHKDTPLRNEELALAIDEFIEGYLSFLEYYEQNPNQTQTHAFYGPLNFDQWCKLNRKHLTHHFKQFGLM